MTYPARLDGRHIVVTGAGTGIGRAIAQRLANDGATLTLMARGIERLEETARQVRDAARTPVVVVGVDVRDRAAVDGAFARAAEAHGPIHALVANSGIGGENIPGADDRFDDLITTNLTGSYSCAQATLRHLAPGPGARQIVFMSSILGRIGVPGYTGYCASKAGLLGLARALAMDVAGDDVHVNAVCPGWVATEMAQQGIQGIADGMGVTYDEAFATAMSAVPMARMSEPEDIAGMVRWLLSDDARGVTGQALDMNGGAYTL